MSDFERHQQIVNLLRDRPFASVRDLQEQLGVSASTIRRDIDKIDEVGSARKVYGGISALDGPAQLAAFARPYDENRDLAVDAKTRIANFAATMVHDGDAIIVNGGSTCFHLGARLADRNVRLFTNSMPLAAYLGEHGSCSLVVAGGDLHREPRIIYSPHQQADFYASTFFLGAQAIGSDGIMESHPLLVRSMQELSHNADRIVILADSRKFQLNARRVALPLSRISAVVTDSGISEQSINMLEDAGIDVRIAEDGSTL